MKKTWLIIVVLVLLVGGYFWLTYNSLITKNEVADSQWAQVEVQYQRRFDLIPNLVASVRGFMTQEKTIFENLAEARTRYAGAATVNDKASAASAVETGLARLLVVMENYPALRSVETVQGLMVQLEGTENRVSVERKRFNDTIRDYNLIAKRFPGSVVARLAGFDERAYFEAAEGTDAVPAVNL